MPNCSKCGARKRGNDDIKFHKFPKFKNKYLILKEWKKFAAKHETLETSTKSLARWWLHEA